MGARATQALPDAILGFRAAPAAPALKGSDRAMDNQALEPEDQPALSHNLLGQRLGRKGRVTRERILAATARLLASDDAVVSLSAVAREASLGMTTLYLYFGDLSELLIATLDPIMESAEESYIAHMRTRWPDDELAVHCMEFVVAYHAFWQKHTRILHLRNSLADANDKQMRLYRIAISTPVIQLLARQMEDETGIQRTATTSTASVLMTGIERLVTVTTDTQFPYVPLEDKESHVGSLLRAWARVLEISVRDRRDRVRIVGDVAPLGFRGKVNLEGK